MAQAIGIGQPPTPEAWRRIPPHSNNISKGRRCGMTRLEIITRLCEMAAELADLQQQAQEPDVKVGVSCVEEQMQKTLRELQGES